MPRHRDPNSKRSQATSAWAQKYMKLIDIVEKAIVDRKGKSDTIKAINVLGDLRHYGYLIVRNPHHKERK